MCSLAQSEDKATDRNRESGLQRVALQLLHPVPTALNCPEGQTYLQCGTFCNTTCRSLSHPEEECPEACLEGCFCPPGLYQDERGDCVPQAQCPCYYDGEIFQPEDIFSDHHTMW